MSRVHPSMILRPCQAGFARHLRHIFALLGHFSNHGSNGSHTKKSRICCAHKKTSEGDVPVLSSRSQFFLVKQHLERSSEAAASLVWFDDVIKVTECCSLVRVCKLLISIFCEPSSLLFGISSMSNAALVNDFDSTVGAHNR